MVMQFDPAIFSDFFETDELGRRALFESFIPQGFTGAQRQQAGQLFIPTFNQFLGNLGTSLRQGQTPQSFQNFVQNDFNLTRGLARFPQAATPGLTSRAQFTNF